MINKQDFISYIYKTVASDSSKFANSLVKHGGPKKRDTYFLSKTFAFLNRFPHALYI